MAIVLFVLAVGSARVYGQASLQRGVRISNANGNIITILTGTNPLSYTLLLPPTSNPSTTSASLLYGIGSGQLGWTNTGGVASGNILTLQLSGSNLVPTWSDPASVLSGNYWALTGNAITTAYNGTTGSFIGTTNTQPLIIATTNTTTPQPIEFYTNNTEVMRLTSGGELGIGLTPTAGRTLHVAGTAGTADVRLNSLSGSNVFTAISTNDGLVFADVNGDLTKRDISLLNIPLSSSFVKYDVTSTQNVAVTRTDNLFNVSYGASANDANAAGAVITSAGGATNRSATGLTITTTATGSGTSTGLSVSATGGASNTAIAAIGNINVLSNGGTASQLSLQNPSGTFSSSFVSGAQTANLSYTLPITAPTASQVLISSGGATSSLSWADASTLLSGNYWNLTGNSITTGYNGTTGNFLGTTNTQPLVIATTNTATPQPIEFFTNNSERMRLSSSGKLGLGTSAPNVSLDVAADFATREYNYTTSLSGTINDVNFDGVGNLTSYVRVGNATADFTLTGIGGGQNGKLITLYNATTKNLILANQSASSVAANRIVSGTGGNLTVPPNGSANLTYSPTDSRWFVNSINDLATINASFWSLSGNSGTTAYNGTTGNFLGTTDAQPLVIGTTNTVSSQPIKFYTNNAEKMRLSPAGELGIGLTPTSGRLLQVGGNSGDLNIRFNALSGADGATALSSTDGFVIADANGDLTKRTYTTLVSPLSGYFVNYDVTTPQNLSLTRTDNLFNVAYSASANDADAAGAVITATGGATNRNATGLTISAAATGTGTATGLSVSATGGSKDYAALFTGSVGIGTTTPTQGLEVKNANLLLSNSTATASQLQFQGTSTGITAFKAGAQGATNITYTLPTSLPVSSGYVLSSTTGGTLSWVASGGTVTGTGTATRVAFWGPGPGVTSQLMDDAALYWDNTNKRLGINVGTTPNTAVDIAKDLATREYSYTTATTSTMNDVNFDGSNNQTSFIRISNAAAGFTITGIAGGANGKHLQIYNATSQTMTVANQSTSSVAANRVITGTGVSLVIPAGGTANFIYSGTDTRWISYAASVGSSAWLTTGNSGLVDNVTNFLGTIDNTNVRFVTGSGGPNTRMMIDFSGNELLGPGATTTTFSSGSGRFAYGDMMTTARLNSVPTYLNRVFNMIDQNAVLRVWRFNSNAGGTDPAIELVGGTNDNQGNSANQWWDVMSTGTPGVANTGTGGGYGEHMTFRRRSGSSDSEYLSIFAGGNVGIGNDNATGVPTPDTRLTVRMTSSSTNSIIPVINAQSASTGRPVAGFGSAIDFKAEDSTTLNQQMAQVAGVWTSVNHTSRTGALTFSTVNSGTLSEAMRILGNNNIGIGLTTPSQLIEARNGNLLLSNNNATASSLMLQGTSSGVSSIKAGAQGTTTINYTLPTSQPSAGQVLSASSVSGSGPYNVSLGWSTSSGTGTAPEYAIKSADQSIANSATLTNDNDLSLAIGANETWEVSGELIATSASTTPDIKIAFTVPSGATLRIWLTGRVEDATTTEESRTLSSSGVGKSISITTSAATLIHFQGWVQNSSTSGNVTMQWAQNTSSGTAVVLKADSYMKMLKLN
ncbi:MAG: hypothetical protein JSS75_12405 [Bacteroidetes bacterium]|nr:hypothetical protein [Bacteroidota bacterium]